LAAVITASCFTTGCTIINIEGGQPARAVRLGLLRVEPAAGADLMVVKTKGIGLVPSRSGVTFGLLNETMAVAYDRSRCQVIVFEMPKDSESEDRLTNLLQRVPSICRVGEEQRND